MRLEWKTKVHIWKWFKKYKLVTLNWAKWKRLTNKSINWENTLNVILVWKSIYLAHLRTRWIVEITKRLT